MKHQKLVTSHEISMRMSKVKLKGNSVETKLAKGLWHTGIRYRLNDKNLPGSPDIAISKYKIAIFVDGGFWHGKDWEHRKGRLKSNREYWIEKIEENITRDRKNDDLLMHNSWTPLHFWDDEVVRNIESCIDSINDVINLKKKAE